MTDLRSRIAALSPEQRALLESRIAGLAERHESPQPDRIPPRDRSRPTPLGLAQQREWAIERLRAANNISGAFRVIGRLDLDQLSHALTEITRRHEVLRSTIEIGGDGTPVQVVHPVTPVPVPVIDLSHLPDEKQQDEVRLRCKAEILRPFEERDPHRLRITLLRLAADTHIALFITDHAAGDAWSLAILVQELAALYASGPAGAGDVLPPPEIQFGDFAAWQRGPAGAEHAAAEVQHWRQVLEGMPEALALPTDRPTPVRPTFAGDTYNVRLSAELAADLRRFCERENASLFMILLAACSVLLYRYLEQDDLIIGSLVSGRNRLDTERLVGCFANPLPLRMRLSGDQDLRTVVGKAREVLATALDHQDLNFDRLIEELGLGREASQTSLSRLWINVLSVLEAPLELPGLRIAPEPIDLGLASVDLTLSAIPRAGTLELQWQYMTEVLDADTVKLLASQFERVLRQIIAAADTLVRDVALSASPVAPPTAENVATGFVELFQRRAAIAPYAPAVVCDGIQTSYGDLNRASNRLARHLRTLGIGPQAHVGILVERSARLAVAILGVLKAGAAYVPLDPAYPPERIAFMLNDAGARALVTQERLARQLTDAGISLPTDTVMLDLQPLPDDSDSDLDLPDGPDPASLAYIVYTSGSTGLPKGAMIEHRSLVTFAQDVVERLGLGTGDRFLQFASPSFDVLVEELFPTWLAGGAVAMTAQHIISGQVELAELAEREWVTVLELPTAYWHEWVRELDRQDRALPRCLRLVIIGGERVLPDRIATWRRTGVPLMHVYGLTETTVSSTFFRLDPGDPVRDWPNLPIGVPLPSADLRILDSHLRQVPAGASGELYIGGISLARGYLGRPSLTAQRFVADPHPERAGCRLYRTGDVVRQRADGNLEFISRIDTQIKIRGFRVEPTEIESALTRHPAVAESIVAVHEPSPGDRRLVAYVVPCPGATVSPSELRQLLEHDLPAYMVPSAFIELGSLPLNSNGKVDRDRLPEPGDDRPELAEQYVAAQTPLQQKLADIVADVVRISKIGIHDNFFDLGGDSIQAIQVVARAQEAGIGLTPLDFFEHPTVALLAQAATYADTERTVGHRTPDAEPVLSFDQERLWLENQLRPRTAYHVGGRVRLSGPLDPAALEASIRTILARHEVLRARFPTVDGRPVQVTDDMDPDWRLPIEDLAAVNDRADIAWRLMDRQFTTPFDLASGPLIRCLLVKLSDTEHYLAITAHHIVSDVWSVSLFSAELSQLYQAGGDPERAGLPPLAIQYQDYAVWQRTYLEGKALKSHVDYWRDHLSGAPAALALPSAQRSPGAGGGRVRTVLSAEETAAILDLCRRNGATLFMTVLACLTTVLGRWSGQQDVVVGVSMSDRTDTATERLIGFFINTLPLRVRLAGDPTFADVLRQVRQISLDGFAHAEAPLDVLVRELKIARDPRRTPLFQVILNVIDVAPVDRIGDLGLEVMDSPQLLSSFDLICTAQQSAGELLLRLEYNAELYEPAMMQVLLDHLRAFLLSVARDPQQGIFDYPLPGGEAQGTALEGESGNAETLPWQPDRVAVIDHEGEWDYQWLSEAAGKVATAVPAGERVGIVRRPTAAFAAAVLGCLAAGAEPCVLGPADSAIGADLPMVLDMDPPGNAAATAVSLRSLLGAESGTPRVDGPGVTACLDGDWAVSRFAFTAGDRFAVLSPVPGHLVAAMSAALRAGAALVLPEPSVMADARALASWLRDAGVTVLYTNPPLLRALTARAPAARLAALRYAFVANSGDLISRDIEALHVAAPGCQCVGMYRVAPDGRPLAVYPVPAGFQVETAPLRIPLGTDLRDNPAQLRHAGGQLAATGEVAEICFGSYHTGDLGRRWTDGTLEFIGKLREGSPSGKGK
jgi:amino acid adenylation domain-containing protein